MIEKRRFTRVSYSSEAVLTHGNTTITGTVANISMKGLYLQTFDKIPVQEAVEVCFYTPLHQPVKMQTRVAHSDQAGVALEISSMPVSSFVNLRDLVTRNSSDPETIFLEGYSVIECLQW